MLISDKYLQLNKDFHNKQIFGNSGANWALLAAWFIHRKKITTILDYGCGEGSIKRFFKEHLLFSKSMDNFYEYDPAVEGKNALPSPADFIICTDVLEHIELECLDTVFSHIYSLMLGCGFFVISLRGSNNILGDGKDSHRIIENALWWKERLLIHNFILHELDIENPKYFVVFVRKG